MIDSVFKGRVLVKIIIATDSFKGSIKATEAAQVIDKGVKRTFPNAETVLLPIGDGGEGTMEALVLATGGEVKQVKVTSPLLHEVEAEYGVLGDGKTCVIELASASGLDLVAESQLAPLNTTTYGTGELIKQGLDDGFSKFIIGLGGSATNDGGVGILQALGMKFLDSEGNDIGYGGGVLGKVHSINTENFDKRIKDSHFIIASDVQNPLIGRDGASYIFGPQKGATLKEVEILDKNIEHWADVVYNVTNVKLHHKPGSGAAGGTGGAFQAFFPMEMKRGIDVVLDYIQLDKELVNADLVITGEGRVDSQTIYGKTPLGVAQKAKEKGVPTVILAGSVGPGTEELYNHGVTSIHSIVNSPMTLEEAMKNAKHLLESCSEQVVRSYFHEEI